MDRVPRAPARAAYEVMSLVARHPALAMPAARLRRHGELVSPSTDVVIEGYPRSANSFSVAAFALAQGWPEGGRGRIAHHTHAPAHVIAAVRAKVPAIVLVRDPADAVLEFVIVKPALTLRQALRGYLRFYEPLIAYRSGFVVGAFEEVTADLGAVIERLNRRFGTSFVPFEHTPENVQACFDAMEGYWSGLVGTGPALERFVGRPSALREGWKGDLRDRYDGPELTGLRERARLVHERFAGLNGSTR